MNKKIKDMTDKELNETIKTFEEHALAVGALRAERFRREDEAIDGERDKFLTSAKFKKLSAAYKKAIARVRACGGEHEITLDVPVTFKVTATIFESAPGDRPYHFDLDDILELGQVEAQIGQGEGINKVQRAILQEGINMVVEEACEQIYKIFPGLEKEQEDAVKELNKVIAAGEDDLEAYDITIDDIS